MTRTAMPKNPQRTSRVSKKAPAAMPARGRTGDGKFAAGNAGGPGNPHARHCARMLALFRSCISDDEMVSIIRVLVHQAINGDASAAKLLLSYKIGKPAPAPNPDQIDRDEWELYQRDTINLEEMQQVLGSLPTRVGNDIARTALPIITQVRKAELASQLVENLPDARKPTKAPRVANQQAPDCAPIANGKSNDINRASQSTTNDQRSTTNETSPTPNHGNLNQRKNGRGNSKNVKPEWLRQMAGKVGKIGGQ